MDKEEQSVRDVIDRILVSYGVRTRQAYSDLAKIPLPTISNWVKRGKVPGDYIVQCALDTGADLKWLMEGGELTNVRFEPGHYPMQGIRLLEAMQSSGGKEILQRIMQAYGFTMQKELGDHLDIPSGTMSAWVRREHFPGDVVIVCALDTGASLYWLATGNGGLYESNVTLPTEQTALATIRKYRLENGELKKTGNWLADPSMIPDNHDGLMFVEGMGKSWLVDISAKNIANGRWLISIDGAMDVFNVIRLPGNKVRLSNGSAEFECNLSDITPSGTVIFTIEKHI
ncbi:MULTISPECIES: phage repressor protein CI [Klebsiella]|mgnify:FL=1|uniref:phage repressor protein CI n=1 Tax=Klebsiella TaxID=570 RepID=UPI0007CC8F68|nr:MULTISPECIES: phage repressor protein CI [Klebsiella]MBT9344949.1 helix-turn-helix domain-containing protein [Providencia stuartii]MDU7382123.1 phage repressor protein CI [Enterobacteriaceae bacterium]HDX9110027.1 phage repressor protein CI [Klebsiella michiganensis]AWE03413.1 phage repressor protein CI [Klebsiella pneumoniae]AWX86292.1 phage repressor protein CI [Klebsiella quasipneumoniae subsp. quasipneumoniae]